LFSSREDPRAPNRASAVGRRRDRKQEGQGFREEEDGVEEDRSERQSKRYWRRGREEGRRRKELKGGDGEGTRPWVGL